MKLRFPSKKRGVAPIMTTVEEEFDSFRQLQAWEYRIEALKMEIKRQKNIGQQIESELLDELESARAGRKKLFSQYPDHERLPEIMVSHCPYCNQEIWMWVDVFALDRQYWHRKKGGLHDVGEDRCPHLFCVDGALNLNGHQPKEVQADPTDNLTNDRIRMAAEVPFVKPRVLNLPSMVAVIYQFPVAQKYTAYPIAYFAERQPDEDEFCLFWARTEFESVRAFDGDQGQITMTGKRRDIQDYELEKWVKQGKVLWLDPDDEDHPVVRGPAEAFPYYHLPGRRHPYTIKNGRVQNLLNPTKDTKPTIDIEYFHWTF